tara:strand:- start:322 stop:1209 length:888 start_codon:yes stop_codon:yes gene_type:complete
MSEENKGNSAAVTASDSEDFFGKLEQSVNGMVADSKEAQPVRRNTKVTQRESGSNMATHNESQGSNVEWDNENNPYKKRYTDSSREAVKMSKQLNELKPFVPVLNAMKRDSGLVDHVRDYLKGGGKPSKNIKEQLNLSEDFVYDANEAIENPDSESAQVMQAQIDSAVNSRVGDVLKQEKAKAMVTQKKLIQRKAEIDFIKRHNMSKEQYMDFKNAAKQRNLSLDDVYYLLNKDKANQNVANNTKKDMLNQMKNVRDIPTTASDSNNQGTAQASPTDSMFDAMLGVDGDVDNLFG